MKKFITTLSLSAVLVLSACGEESSVEQVDADDEEEDVEEVEENTSDDEAIDDEATEDEEESTEEEGQEEDSISIGDTVNFDGLHITLNDAYTSSGNDFETPSNDHYVILDLTIENTTDESANISTLLQMGLQDEEGYTHDVALFTDTQGSLDGEIGPDRDNRGEVAFDVNDSDVYEFIFENPFTSGQAIWEISDIE
ncbi:DUF4352 domain-containing protein [Evansella halocellulosilytica]|uniref:DUF4352 domain-containing protein n=1 Tax=Evansella halocellulosilytica TaxID=2011013 RepID=UPI000BB77D21|nr:DUF4352 domain-containing protein [Evansella halocellulosilytica]